MGWRDPEIDELNGDGEVGVIWTVDPEFTNTNTGTNTGTTTHRTTSITSLTTSSQPRNTHPPAE
ncbi:hypothetical protein EX30DRAFT_341985 [Ascodesmis nigricans]|uniref:Uncharacterized protein n=1 Tax=Ascodesmis nigricans TaxID=341454 RepID=A0A4S2MTN9_9PEZI|nr:hypothetical protein EX30DRAFT_341985 [Ascodesmis nigricans]